MKKLILFILIAFNVIVTFAQTPTTIPGKIAYQGKLLENGTPVTGTKDIVFSIPGTGWTETHAAVSITEGLYSVQLGSVTPIPVTVFNSPAVSLEVTVEGTTLSPQVELLSVPYAYKADDAAKIAGDSVSTTAPAIGQTLQWDGTAWVPGEAPTEANMNQLELMVEELLRATSLLNSFTTPKLWITEYGYDAGGWRVETTPRMMADVNGDGRQDVVGFDSAGVMVALSTGTGFSAPEIWVNEYGYIAGGWQVGFTPRMMADVNGDGMQDVVGFAGNGVRVSLSTGTGFTAPELWVNNYGYTAGGWQVGITPRMMADVNGDGMQDVVGFDSVGIMVSLSTGTGFTTPELWVNNYGYNDDWRVEITPRMMADVNGDGMQDVVGFGYGGVYVSLSTGTGFTAPEYWVNDYGYNAGWRIESYPRMMADINGDGMQDVVGFGGVGVYISLSTGTGFTVPELVETNFGYNLGWRVDKHPRMMADVNGDGMQDAVGFAHAGVSVALSTGTGFATSELRINAYGYDAGGWRVEKHPRMMADVNGDGLQDVVGFSDDGVEVSLSIGSSFELK